METQPIAPRFGDLLYEAAAFERAEQPRYRTLVETEPLACLGNAKLGAAEAEFLEQEHRPFNGLDTAGGTTS